MLTTIQNNISELWANYAVNNQHASGNHHTLWNKTNEVEKQLKTLQTSQESTERTIKEIVNQCETTGQENQSIYKELIMIKKEIQEKWEESLIINKNQKTENQEPNKKNYQKF